MRTAGGKEAAARKTVGRQLKEFSKSQLNTVLAEAIANAARLPR
jgi:hypothetical protein